MSESSPEPHEEATSSLDGIDAKKLLTIATVGALGLGALIYKVAHDKLRSTPFEISEESDEDL